MTANNPNLDLINEIAYMKFGEVLSICSQDIERKRSSDHSQGPKFWYKFAKNAR